MDQQVYRDIPRLQNAVWLHGRLSKFAGLPRRSCDGLLRTLKLGRNPFQLSRRKSAAEEISREASGWRIPENSAYLAKLIEKNESVLKGMRWKAFFYYSLEDKAMKDENTQEHKEHYSFKSRKCPKQIKELVEFEKEVLDTISNIKFHVSIVQ